MAIKIITGFRKDQKYTIEDREAHKAYYLFLNPDKRGVFDNGVALVGSMIQGIEPDYHATMGWNDTHVLDSDDWNDMRSKGVDLRLRNVLENAKDVATHFSESPSVFSLPLAEAKALLPKKDEAVSEMILGLADSFKLK